MCRILLTWADLLSHRATTLEYNRLRRRGWQPLATNIIKLPTPATERHAAADETATNGNGSDTPVATNSGGDANIATPPTEDGRNFTPTDGQGTERLGTSG